MGIAAKHISKSFGGIAALDDVTVQVGSGRLTALLGPSGGGKSTLLRIIGGLEEPDSGSVVIDGIEATDIPAQRRNVGFVFQHYAAFKHLSVYRNIAFGLEIRKRPKAEIKQRVTELLELVHLRQVYRPDAIAAFRWPAPADGPGPRTSRRAVQCCCSTNRSERFDTKVRKELRDWLRRLHDEVHVTTVFVTHDQDEALEVADELVVYQQRASGAGGFAGQVVRPPGQRFRHGLPRTGHSAGPAPGSSARYRRVRRADVRRRRGEGNPTATGRVRGTCSCGHTTPSRGFSWTRGQAESLALRPGDTVWLRAAGDASTLTAS